MEKHFLLSDDEFLESFTNTSMDPKVFTHEGHLRLAWIHIRRFGLHQAVLNVCEQIERFDQVHGDGNKFDEKLTVACVQMVHDLMSQSGGTSFSDFLKKHPELRTDFSSLLTGYLNPIK